MEDGKVKAIFGVGNKTELYVKDDVIQLELVANELSKVLKQRKIEAELRGAKEKYHSLFANMLNGFAYCEMIFDKEGKPVDFVYLEINDAFERLTGLRRENVVGRKVSEAIPGTREANPEIFEIYGRVAKTGNPERFELFFKPLSIWLYISVYSPSRGYFAAVFENVTERKLLQRRLEEKATELEEYATRMEELAEERALKLKDAERMAAIGQTAGMVGHDIRNPLQAIMSDVFLLKSDLSVVPEGEEKEGMKESLNGLEKNVEYINKIVQDLQDFAKPLKPAIQEMHLDELCEECTLKTEIPENIEASCEVAEDAKKLAADPEMLKRILSNLVSNAVQAMPQGGKILVRAYRDSSDTVITVHDTGAGISKEFRPKLFTPLFTTKSKGQGFGLAVVKRMTEALGGTVTFESQSNEGTTFIVRLPPSKK
jgi:PAS domain S-box-containing protein